ncbi:hypothetical protein BM477_07265 [Boudabousia marimammalium]|uniref:Uncharacterized protein n=2 Tax=Boudabousia marimammalium TaxID=156892 RepID=A0A1Q5PJV0_9ACTO|nr:hypothetical protein BM477_07265 [Boudabousia marimammalium]
MMKLLWAEDIHCIVTKTGMYAGTMNALRVSSPEFIRQDCPAEGDTFEAAYYGSKPFDVPELVPHGFVFVADAVGTPYLNVLSV